ncbi:MAG: hypothetical protein AAGA17_10920 [Actinomycetota bacterium]
MSTTREPCTGELSIVEALDAAAQPQTTACDAVCKGVFVLAGAGLLTGGGRRRHGI